MTPSGSLTRESWKRIVAGEQPPAIEPLPAANPDDYLDVYDDESLQVAQEYLLEKEIVGSKPWFESIKEIEF